MTGMCGKRSWKRSVENVVSHTDYHTTLYHLFGLDPKKLTFRRPTGEASLTDGKAGKVVKDILLRPDRVA